MKILLAVTAGLWLLTYASYRSAKKGPNDNFGAGILVLIGWAASIISTAVLFVWALIRGLA